MNRPQLLRATRGLAAVVLLLGAGALPARSAPVVIDNPATPSGGHSVLQPQLVWSVGGESEAEGEFFGVVRQAVIDAAGNTYLLDRQLHEVRVFDREGHFVTSFGRQGEGPGELSNPQDLVLLPDGRIGVLHGRPTRLTAFAPSGGMGEDITLGGGEAFGFTMGIQGAGDHLVAQRSITTLGDGKQTSIQMLVGIDPGTGAHTVEYLRDEQVREQLGHGGRVMIMLNADFVQAWAAGPDGRVYVVKSDDAYRIDVYAPDGTLERTITRAYERARKPDDVFASEVRQRRELSERMGSDFDESEIDRFYPDVADLFVQPDGELWVLPGSGRAEDDDATLGTFDVFDRDGRFVRQVEVKAPFERGEDEYAFSGSDLIVFRRSLDAQRAMNGAGGMFFVTAGGSDEDDEEEPEPLSILRYTMPASR